jgi:N-dimethylarginine dimethylaminohydrolase
MAMEMGSTGTFGAAAYGGEGWSARLKTHAEEIGSLWSACGQNSEWMPLRSVLLHRPGSEIIASEDHNSALQLAPLDQGAAVWEHDRMADAYRAAGVAVQYVVAEGKVRPNQMFCADLTFMTPQGAILARPASTQRAGEERLIAATLARLGIPILRTLTGAATFEGADAMWLDRKTVVIGRGLRTNDDGIRQVAETLAEISVSAIAVDLPYGTMHLMGMLRIVDKDLAIGWPRRTPYACVAALRARGFNVAFIPDELEAQRGRAINFVTLGPRTILMVEGCPQAQALYEGLGVRCMTTPAQELSKAAGAVGCLTAVLHRDAENGPSP